VRARSVRWGGANDGSGGAAGRGSKRRGVKFGEGVSLMGEGAGPLPRIFF